ncbi:MAG: hypothetical protein IPK19_40015 [Chloroflexi bacterium]|nr:hypothetical protein [Chloroflexota bacterium]
MNNAPSRPFYRLSVAILPRPTVIGTLVIGAILFGIGLLLGLPLVEALLGAILGVAQHWALELLHHLGHAYAAKRTGYPMQGVRVGMLGILAMSVYPKDEPKLPGRIHIRRALGGPILSGAIGVGYLVLVLLTGERGDLIAWLLRLGLLESVMMSVGALAPIRGLDGGTILYWLRKRV